ncbi:MAG: hypothetical protein ACRCSN_10690 [Dermatophilaceae bacterium]
MKLIRYGVAGSLLLLAAAPGSAQAVQSLRSYSGSDYSVNSTSGRVVDACDREFDGNIVKAEWQRNGSSSLQSTLAEGGSGTCEGAYLSTGVYKHQIVEVIAAARDDYGGFVYPR